MNQRASYFLWLATCLTLTGLACGDSGSGGGDPPPAIEPTEPEPAPPMPPAEPDTGASPMVDAAAGAVTYQTYCAACHGADGDGDTPFAQTLDPPPTAHSNGSYMNGLADAYLFQLIKEGGVAVGKSQNMAPWGGSLSDAQIRNVIAHIRSLADPPYTAPTP